MALKVVFVLSVISLIWINPGETFFRPRPGLVELSSQNLGILSYLRRLFRFDQDETKNPVHDQLALWRKIQQCIRWAQKYLTKLPRKRMEEICMKNLVEERAMASPRKVYDWNIGF